MLAPELSQRQEAKPSGKTSEVSGRQEAKPPGETSELRQDKRGDIKRSMRNTNIKSSKSCHAVLCHTEKTHLQPQTTQCLTTFDPGPCDRSALFARPVAQAWPPPSLWMASILRRFSSDKPGQHRLQTLMASNPPLPSHRQPRSRCANLLRSSLVTNSRWSGLGGVLTQVRHRCTSQASACSTQAQPTVCAVPAAVFTTSRPLTAAKQSPPAPCSMCQGCCGAVWGWGLAFKALRRGQSNFN